MEKIMEKTSYITEVDILDEAKENFLIYAEEVLTDRAIPAVEDGLLSSQRKILWTMEDYLGMDNKSKTKKCNAIVGSTLQTSYFHGDASCYGVLCKLSQEYLMRYPLICGQGSLGTQESNDLVASSRYTEAKPSKYTDLMMTDYKKKVVPEKETYNGEFMEPVVLPSLFPNAICNGRQAIGVSMAHNSLPANLTEVCNGIIRYLKANGNVTLDELMEDIKGPDFPLGGTVVNIKDVKTAYATGKSSVSLRVRGDYEIDGKKIIFTSIPYRTYRNKIKEQINENIEELEKIITDFDDESSIGQNRLVFTVKDESFINTALAKLFSLTDLQTSLSYNMNFIVNGTPRLCSLYDLIKYYVNHQETVLLKAVCYDKDKAEKRLHIVNGLIIAIDKIDEVIELIKSSSGRQDAKMGLMKLLDVDETQADAILDMKLAKISHIDKEELIQEKNEKEKLIKEYNLIIESHDYRYSILSEKIAELRDLYGDERRTKLVDLVEEKEKEAKAQKIIEPEKCIVVMTAGGLVKKIPTTSFKTQSRNTKGIKSQDDITSAIIRTNSVDSLLVFTNRGNMYKLAVDDIPTGTNVSRGVSVSNLAPLAAGEMPAAIYSLYKDNSAEYIVFVTKQGSIKKTSLSEFSNTRKKSGIQAITLADGDSLASVFIAQNENVFLVTENGMGIKFNLADVTPTGKKSAGVRAINLKDGDCVAACIPEHDSGDDIAIFTKSGLGKRVKQNEITVQKRGGKGLIFSKNETIVGAAFVNDEDNVLVNGIKSSVCISAKDIPIRGRVASGIQIIRDNIIQSISKI